MDREPKVRRASESLSPAKRKLLEARLAKATAASGQVPRIPSRPPVERFRATALQRQFWFVDALEPGDPAYNIRVAIELDGSLDIDGLRHALREVVGRHAVLRSRFMLEADELWQEIMGAEEVRLDCHPRSSFGEPEAFLVQLAKRSFALREGPLFRVDLVEVARDRQVLLLVLHHIVCDEVSLAIIVRELAEAYAAGQAGKNLSTPPAVTFADYAEWQRERLPGILDEQLPYWVEQLSDLEERTRVPVESEASRAGAAPGSIVSRKLDMTTLEKAQALAAQENMTLLPLLISAWAALLGRYSGHRDIAVGTPASLRTARELEQTVGLFLNTLVVRTAFDAAQSFRTLLRTTRDSVVDAFSHQEVPFEAVVEAVNPRRARNENPFFDTMVVQETEADERLSFGDVAARIRGLDSGVSKFDVTLFFRPTRDGLLLSLEYDTRLYDARRIEAVLENFSTLLESLIDRPDRPVSDADFLTADEKEWLVHCSNSRWRDAGRSPTVAEQVERNLASLGDASALIDKKGTVTYSELNRLVSNIADTIVDRAPDADCVVVLLDRDRQAVATMLGAWRAGACYVPADPGYPGEHVQRMLACLRSSGLREIVIVTTTAHQHLVPDGVRRILLDRPRSISPSPTLSPARPEPESAAYVIFTSGSSGQPKGVRISHENLRVSTGARREVYATAPGRFLLLSPFAFDSSVAGIYWTLCSGGSLVIAGNEEARDGREIARMIGEHRVTHTLLLPAMYELLLKVAGPEALGSLRYVIVAGEACPGSLYEAHRRIAPDAELHNEYGPSEATVWATVHRVTSAGGPVPIGTPVPSMRTFVLDASGNLQAPGMPGELCLSGPAVSEGYMNAGDGDAFANATILGQRHRIYRTGDRVRYDNHGRLVFIGRMDNQVKVRGHRIEPDQVNDAIRRHFRVTDVATIFDADRQSLHSFVSGADPGAESADYVAGLKAVLPAYMVPQQVSVLDALPRLPNGKLDVSALPGPAAVSHEQEPEVQSYRDLKSIWCGVLGLEDCPGNVSFFDLGGHSLLAARLLVEVQDGLGQQRPLASLYDNPTLVGFHADLAQASPEPDKRFLYPVRPEGDAPPVFAVATYLTHVLPELDPRVPVFGLTHGRKPPGKDIRSVRALAERYLEAVREQQPTGPYRLIGYSFGALLALEIAHQVEASGERMGLLVLIDPPPPVPEGDLRFRLKRSVDSIRLADGIFAKVRAAATEVSRIAGRRFANLKFRLLARGGLVKIPRKSAVNRHLAGEWAKRARQQYVHRPYAGRTLLVLLGRRGFESDENQVSRWKGILTNRTVRVIHGPEDHVDLMQPPWASRVTAEINAALAADPAGGDGRRKQESTQTRDRAV